MKQSNQYHLQIKWIYTSLEDSDGCRILVDRLWPRGIKKENAHIDQWCREIAPSSEIRKQFNHVDANYPLFAEAYRKELEQNEAAQQMTADAERILKTQNLTLLYSAKNEQYNNAVVLCAWLNEKIIGENRNGK